MVSARIGFLLIGILLICRVQNAFAAEKPDKIESGSLSQAQNTQTDWESYYQVTVSITEPRQALRNALKYFQIEGLKGGRSADLGAGAGRDTLFMLQEGWQVMALDSEPLSIDILLRRANPETLDRLTVTVAPFTEMILPDELDLINASFSLPFCHPEDFPACWQNIVDHLAVGGRFSGQFFGEKDEWAGNHSLTFHSYDALLELFQDRFIIEYLQIETGLTPCMNGSLKQGHVYHLVAKKVK